MNARAASVLLLATLLGCSLEHPDIRSLDAGDASVSDVPDVSLEDLVIKDVPPPEDLVDASSDDTPDVPEDAVVAEDIVDVPIVTDVPEDIATADAPVMDAGADVADVPVAMDRPDVADVPMVTDRPDVADVPMVTDRPDVVAPPVDSGPTIYASCEAARLMGRPSGAYLIRAGGAAPWLAWCDTGDTTGAWTLVLKADGRQPTFLYDQAIWGNTALLNPGAANLDRVEAKFQGFLGLPVNAIRVQMVTPADGALTSARTIVLAGNGMVTMQGIFASNIFVDYRSVTSEEQWFALVPGSSLQDRCIRRGLNVRSQASLADRVRIGMIGNENRVGECDSHDSRLGVGGAGAACGGARASNSVGNAAGCNGGSGDRDLRSFAYLWVR